MTRWKTQITVRTLQCSSHGRMLSSAFLISIWSITQSIFIGFDTRWKPRTPRISTIQNFSRYFCSFNCASIHMHECDPMSFSRMTKRFVLGKRISCLCKCPTPHFYTYLHVNIGYSSSISMTKDLVCWQPEHLRFRRSCKYRQGYIILGCILAVVAIATFEWLWLFWTIIGELIVEAYLKYLRDDAEEESSEV